VNPLFVIHTEASLGWGGQEIRVLTEMAGMSARGHRMLLVCPAEARIFGEAQARGLQVAALPIGKKHWSGLHALRQLLKTLHPDLVVTHSSTDSWLVALSTRFWHTAPPAVRIRHISAPVGRNAATRWLYARAAAHVVTTGERLRQKLIADLHLPETHVTSVPTGIDLARYSAGDRSVARRELGLAEDGCIIGIIATLRSWKGHRYLFDAFAQLDDKQARLLVVGDGPGFDNLRRQAEELGISARVIMPGNQAEVAPWFAALDVFVLPSYANEGVPQAIMQAQASGLPVVSTPVGSIPEIVADGLTGLLVPARDTAALKAALARLLIDGGLRSRLGVAALAQARERYSDSRMLDRMEAIFCQVVEKS
jgi:glycosyltransferase involved in cell wall biosynthesis